MERLVDNMKRSLKNIIMIIVLIFMCGLVIFTMNCAKEHSSSKNKISNVNDSETFKDKLPSDLNEPSQNNDSKEEKPDDNSNMKELPEKPEGDSNMEEPPEKPAGDNTSFYGMNSAILAKSGANLTLKNITVITSAAGANDVFSYGGSLSNDSSSGDGTTITINDSKIITNADNSGGIMTTGGGIMNAYNLDIETSGTSSAAIRTDRGGGVVTVSGGTYKTKGQGSPTIYSTADVIVNDATLTSEASEGIVIEGKNSVTINNCTLTDTNNKLNGQTTTYKNIFLYQSMSGDALLGTSSFTFTNSKIVTNKGDTLYVTNTKATINLTNNTIINNDETGIF